MSQSNDSTLEIRRIRRLLKHMHELAAHSSLTGALSGGAADAVAQYNVILGRVIDLGIASPGLFQPLPEDASFDRLGVASALLESYLAEEEKPAEDSGKAGAHAGHKIIIGNVTGLEDLKDLKELKDLGRMIRDNLPDFLRRRVEEDQPAPPAPPTPPSPPAPPAAAPEAPRSAASGDAERPIPMPDLSR